MFAPGAAEPRAWTLIGEPAGAGQWKIPLGPPNPPRQFAIVAFPVNPSPTASDVDEVSQGPCWAVSFVAIVAAFAVDAIAHLDLRV